MLAGFTPSDAAHTLGRQTMWDVGAAVAGAELYGWYTGDDAATFASCVYAEMARRSAACVLEVAFDGDASIVLDDPIVASVIGGTGKVGAVEVSLGLATPLIAVGGPAGIFYEEVADRIGASLVLPEGYAVANAVGAAAGSIVVRTSAEVHGDGPGSYRIVTLGGTARADDADEAIETATEAARSLAEAALIARAEGIGEIGPPSEVIDVTRHDDPNAADGKGLYSAKIRFELRARPCA